VLEIVLITEPYMMSTLDMAKGLCEQDECKLLSDIFRGLAFMHAQGYLHRDLKPRNIGVTFTPPRAVLLDLGACMEGLSSSDHMVGTVTYLAPEVVLLKKQASVGLSLMPPYTASADVWSATLAGAEMVCRYVLSRIWSAAGQWVSDHYIGQAQSYLRDRQQHASPRFRQAFHLLESALAPEPDSRPTAQQLAIDLYAVLHDLQTLDAGDTPEERPSTRLKVGK
jgi:serine/threonine protein kinase